MTADMVMARDRHEKMAYVRVSKERSNQLHRWSDAHDEQHTPAEWVALIQEHLDKARAAADGHERVFRDRLTAVGALVFAALEARERRRLAAFEATIDRVFPPDADGG